VSPSIVAIRLLGGIYLRQAIALVVVVVSWLVAPIGVWQIFILVAYFGWLLVNLAFDFFTVQRLRMPDYDPRTILPTAIGAVSAFQTFTGVIGGYYLASIGVSAPMPPLLFANSALAVYFLWTFGILTARFEDFCYLYHLWRVRTRARR